MKSKQYQLRKVGTRTELLAELYDTMEAAHAAIAFFTKDYPERSGKNFNSVEEAQAAHEQRLATFPEYQIVLKGGDQIQIGYVTRDGKVRK